MGGQSYCLSKAFGGTAPRHIRTERGLHYPFQRLGTDVQAPHTPSLGLPVQSGPARIQIQSWLHHIAWLSRVQNHLRCWPKAYEETKAPTVYFCHLTMVDRKSCLFFTKLQPLCMRNRGFQSLRGPITFQNKPGARQCAAHWPEVKDAIPGMNFIGDQVTLEAAQEIGERKPRAMIV